MRTSLMMTTAALVGLLFYLAYAVDGQIEGRITDKQTGDPISGASVSVVGTGLGAQSDLDGYYRILAVPPGQYALRVSRFDYATYTLDSVVVSDTQVCVKNFALDSSVLDLNKSIEVRASAATVDKFVTESRTTISCEAIKAKPVQSVDKLLEQVAGVATTQTGDVYIRGGRGTSIPVIVSGQEVADPLGGVTSHRPPPGLPRPPAHGGTAILNNKPFDAMFFENYGVNPFVDTEDDQLSTFAVDVDDASYVLARNYLMAGFLPEKDAVRVEEFINHFDYSYPPPEHDAFGVHIEGAPSPFGPTASLLLRIGIRGRDITEKDRKPANLIFVIDVSGSMAEGSRLELVKQSLALLVGRLKPDDSIGIVTYGSTGQIALDPTAVRHADHILDIIARLYPSGSTYAEHGIRLGYAMADRVFDPARTNRVILCSDGVANVGQTGADDILALIDKSRKRGVTLTAVGFGMHNYNDVLMEKLANSGDGVYAYVNDLAEARRLFVDNLGGTLETIARDVKIQVDFNPRTVRSYRLLGYENRDVEDAKFRDDTEDGGEIGAGHTTTALYELKLHPTPKDILVATVYIRHKDPDADSAVTEVNHRIYRDVFRSRFDHASDDFRLAAAAAEFSEILRQSYWAREGSLRDVRDLAAQVSETQSASAVLEFLNLIDRTIELQNLSVND